MEWLLFLALLGLLVWTFLPGEDVIVEQDNEPGTPFSLRRAVTWLRSRRF